MTLSFWKLRFDLPLRLDKKMLSTIWQENIWFSKVVVKITVSEGHNFFMKSSDSVIKKICQMNESECDHFNLNKKFISVFWQFQNSWTLWFFKNDKNRNWEDNQRSIITFNTVEDFWALYNHIELASKLNAGCDYSLFKVRKIKTITVFCLFVYFLFLNLCPYTTISN